MVGQPRQLGAAVIVDRLKWIEMFQVCKFKVELYVKVLVVVGCSFLFCFETKLNCKMLDLSKGPDVFPLDLTN